MRRQRRKKKPLDTRTVEEILGGRTLPLEPQKPDQLERIISRCMMASRNNPAHADDLVPKRLEVLIAEVVRMSRSLDPGVVRRVDGLIAAEEPGFLIREMHTHIRGGEEILERLRVCCDLHEFDRLEELLRLVMQRIAQIREALTPLVQRPS
jgi:hypothetical protein